MITPLSNAPTNSPDSTKAASLSINTLPFLIASSSHSIIDGLNDPTISKCAPSFNSPPFTNGASEFVAQLTISPNPTTSSKFPLLSKITPSNSLSFCNFSTKDCAFLMVLFQIMTVFNPGRTARWARIKCGAKEPAPTITRVLEFSLDKNLEAKAEMQEVR
nr:hypothetical protein Itr_chr05CG23570 [Ipomoea trifida]